VGKFIARIRQKAVPMKRVSQPSMKERLEARDWNFYSALSSQKAEGRRQKGRGF
jgi:hypothetical protein